MDYLSQPWLISLIVVSIGMAIGLGVAAFHIRRLYRVQHAMELIVKELIKTRDSSKKKFGELQSVSLGAGQKLIELERKLVALNEVQQEMSVQTPENKLYSRAVKMVELGAGIEEIMQECELPKAEAELLLSLHKHRSGN
nr:DUF2802 domain-containing protein [uncultured Tolumonas sp.]